jgi:hypothetical protein
MALACGGWGGLMDFEFTISTEDIASAAPAGAAFFDKPRRMPKTSVA